MRYERPPTTKITIYDCRTKARKPARIGVVFDGIFWQNLHDWREYAHPEPKRFDMKGVLDSMRWYAANTVFSRPPDDVAVPAKHLIWTDGRRRNDLKRIMELAGIEFRCARRSSDRQRLRLRDGACLDRS